MSRIDRVPAVIASLFLAVALGTPALAFAQRGGDPRWDNDYRYGRVELTAGLRTRVEPKDAEVYVDGFFVGHVDNFDGIFQKLRLPAGRHQVAFWRDGFRTEFHNLYFEHDRTHTLDGRMVPLRKGQYGDPRPGRGRGYGPPPWAGGRGGPGWNDRYDDGYPGNRVQFGTVSLNLPMLDAQIFVNGSRRTWQRRSGNRYLLDLEPGRHRIEVRRAGYTPFWREVVVRPGATISIDVTLNRG
jgi:hypothetical protein